MTVCLQQQAAKTKWSQTQLDRHLVWDVSLVCAATTIPQATTVVLTMRKTATTAVEREMRKTAKAVKM